MSTELYLNDGAVCDFGDFITTELRFYDPGSSPDNALITMSVQNVNDTDTLIMMYFDEDMLRKTIKYLENILIEHNNKDKGMKA